jgi:drug/metabolite transporter (DMT)-like permease
MPLFTLAQRPLPEASRGIVLMLGGVALLTSLDGTVKALTQTYSVPQAMFFRCLLALPLLFLALRWDGGLRALRTASLENQLLRGLLAFLTGYTFFTAVDMLPLADVLAVSFVAPFLIALLAGPMLGETVSRRQWIAIAGGFVGVLIVLRPGGGPGEAIPFVPAAWALAAAVCYALASIVLRKLGRTDSASVTTIWSTAVPLVLYGITAWPGWQPVQPEHWPLMALAGALGASGLLMIGAAFRLAPAATLAPLEYSAIVWAVLIGLAFFGDVPGWPVLLGTLVIVGSGLALARGR